jgi:FkbM family methyltransferase
MKKIIYYLMTLVDMQLENKIVEFLKKEKKITVFDIGCYKGSFTQKVLDLLGKKKSRFYLFDANKNVKKYISHLIKFKNINYNEVALHNKNGKAIYHHNSSFESSGSSLSTIIKDDSFWVLSRKFILKMFFLSTKGFSKYTVPTITLDNFVKKEKIKSIELLKIDIEGSEHLMLQGAKNTLKKNKIRTILIEICDKKNIYEKKEKKILSLLKKYDFELIKKNIYLSPSFLSNHKAGDYQLINTRYYSKKSKK